MFRTNDHLRRERWRVQQLGAVPTHDEALSNNDGRADHRDVLWAPGRAVPSHKDAPRAVITNGMMVPNYSTRKQYERLYAMAAHSGQMTAGSYCYIGPQGIVHGTTITIKNQAASTWG